MTPSVRSAGKTDTGKVRRRNEDAILVRDDLGLWVVADGLGGHAAGDFASGIIVQRLGALNRQGDIDDFIEAIEDTLQTINADLRAAAASRSVELIASTVVMLVYDRDFALCGWVGDSHAYTFHDGALRRLTRDHVRGDGDGPDAGALTRAIGADDHVHVDWVVMVPRPGTRFILCSDGVNKELSDDELHEACRRHDEPHQLLDNVFGTALSRSARDNISAVIVGWER
ncbi:MAG: Protein phosphatase PrpC [Luteibacter sp.]|uniref:PP2C family protein-serine/threonine phosphatase n=1 Tax=Luteibacter sp. TaxID=1886636 RepID=UPI0013842E8C|nr:PP2C family serine/threonine-protein phosphatase [Luteibacter sp.]KAF1009016.1 MAG: Protein phosphatase PrpC [Luteibacter sp.]